MSEDREREKTGADAAPGPEDSPSFTVRDRRVFTQDESATQDGAGAETPPQPEPEPARGPSERQQTAAEEAADAASARAKAQGSQPMPEIDFGTFVISLSTSAMYHLGVIPDPESKGEAKPNLPLAKQTIDILGMLKDKTEGNRTDDESRLLEGLLYDLRIRYVNSSKK